MNDKKETQKRIIKLEEVRMEWNMKPDTWEIVECLPAFIDASDVRHIRPQFRNPIKNITTLILHSTGHITVKGSSEELNEKIFLNKESTD